MTVDTTIAPDSEADIRWREWRARGAERDRRTDVRLRKAMLLIVAAVVVWFVVQLT